MDRVAGLVPARLHGLRHAFSEMILKQAEGDRLEGPGYRGDLGQDVDAVDVFFHHPLQATDLPLNPAQPLEIGVLVLRVTVHTARIRGRTGRTQSAQAVSHASLRGPASPCPLHCAAFPRRSSVQAAPRPSGSLTAAARKTPVTGARPQGPNFPGRPAVAKLAARRPVTDDPGAPPSPPGSWPEDHEEGCADSQPALRSAWFAGKCRVPGVLAHGTLPGQCGRMGSCGGMT